MSLEERASEALTRSAAHPADAGVRIIGDSRDFVAIHHASVKAVIWERAMPAEIKKVLEKMSHKPFKEGFREFDLQAPFVSVAPGYYKILRKGSPCIPPAITADIITLTDIFREAQGFRKLWREGRLTYQWCKKNSSAPDYGKMALQLAPQFCAARVRVQLSSSYATDDGLGAEWYPGNPSDDKITEMKQAFRAATDITAAKRAFNCQRLKPGDVLMLKGSGGYAGHEQLLVSAPVPKSGAFRMEFLTA